MDLPQKAFGKSDQTRCPARIGRKDERQSGEAVLENGALLNYQILTPSTINASPKDPFGQNGPYEEAVMNTPLIEQFKSPEEFKGADILRVIRSFDPCMPCTTHVYAGSQTIVREVNTCACILEDEGEPVPAGAD